MIIIIKIIWAECGWRPLGPPGPTAQTSSKKKKASQAEAIKQAKTTQPEQPVTSADSDNFESRTTVQIAEQGKKITIRQDSVPYNKTAIQRRKEAAKNPGVVREGTATEDLLATIQANKKSLKCKFTWTTPNTNKKCLAMSS